MDQQRRQHRWLGDKRKSSNRTGTWFNVAERSWLSVPALRPMGCQVLSIKWRYPAWREVCEDQGSCGFFVLFIWNKMLDCKSYEVDFFARILAALKARSFKGGNRSKVTPSLLSTAEKCLIQDAQTAGEDKDVHTHFRTLLPMKQDGLWVVGLRIAHKSPLTPDNRPHILMPRDHPFTHLLMKESHEHSGHRGRDATVAKFRTRFWTSHATKISKSVCSRCQKCKLTKARQMEQIMGQMPPDRLIPSPPSSSVMVDLFGPYAVRGEVQKRVSGKAWGVIFTDLCGLAVHIEITFGFDTQSFMLAFSRFVALRGCPSVIYSDPGSQLVGASAEITQAWRALDKDTLQQRGAEFGMEWRFGPADSPWYQGAVESLVKSAKKAIDHSIKGSSNPVTL